jgi:dipeptidyl aminopeptidase/acylaminoacyl peptidase
LAARIEGILADGETGFGIRDSGFADSGFADSRDSQITRLRAAPHRLYQLPSAGDGGSRPVEVPMATPANVWNATISPDGRSFAYTMGEGRKAQVYVQSMAPGGSRVQITQDGGFEPHWSANGGEVYVINTTPNSPRCRSAQGRR